MKQIKRHWIHLYQRDNYSNLNSKENFIATGQWANGQLAYSMLDPDGKIIDIHDSSFLQQRINGSLVMVRI